MQVVVYENNIIVLIWVLEYAVSRPHGNTVMKNCIFSGGVCVSCGYVQKRKHQTRNCDGVHCYTDVRVGSLLRKRLSWFGIKQTSSCRCSNRERLMNSWGYDGCVRRRDEIVKWLASESSVAGSFVCGLLVDSVLREAKRLYEGAPARECPHFENRTNLAP